MSAIYEARCSECGGVVEVTKVFLDSGSDINVEIKPCGACIESASEEARQEAIDSQATDA